MAERKLSERMADLARDLEAEADPAHTLQHIVDSSVDLVEGCESAGITLAEKTGKISTSAATHDRHAHLDRLQGELGEGPCMDAVWSEHVVIVPHLAHDDRWPNWRERAIQDFGVRSMICVRLFTHEDRVGALNLFSTRTDAFNDDDADETTAIAAHAAVALAAAENIGHLQAAMGNRSVIGEATGLVMTKYNLSSSSAFKVLARLSSEQNRKVAQISREIVSDWDRDRRL